MRRIKSKTSFADLGAPLKLFEGPAGLCDQHVADAACTFCGHNKPVCFRLTFLDDIVEACPSCGTELPFGLWKRNDVVCSCGVTVEFPKDAPADHVVCYSCLRAGRCALSKDTELGRITFASTFSGITEGFRELTKPGYELVPIRDDRGNRRIAARLPIATMLELLHTPSYVTSQGVNWLFCCGEPMTYVGEWTPSDLRMIAPNGGPDFFQQPVGGPAGLDVDQMCECLDSGDMDVYGFRCLSCGSHSAHYDID